MAEKKKLDPEKDSKTDIIAAAKEAGVATSGTRREIVDRIEEAKKGKPAPKSHEERNELVGGDDEGLRPDADGKTDIGATESPETNLESITTGPAYPPKTEDAKGKKDADELAAKALEAEPASGRKAKGQPLVRSEELAKPQAPADHEESKQRELAQKEASVPPSDPRKSVTDHAPGKTADDVVKAREAHQRGENQELERDEIPGPQYYTVKDELDFVQVARELGLPNHSELGAINGIYNGRYEVQKGQQILLPAGYDFRSHKRVKVQTA